MGTIDAPHATLYGALIALVGALIGSASSIAAQFVAQSIIARRENVSRRLREERTLLATRAMLSSFRKSVGTLSVATGSFTIPIFEAAFAAFAASLRQPSLYMDLEPSQINALYEVLSTGQTVLNIITVRKTHFTETGSGLFVGEIRLLLSKLFDLCNDAADTVGVPRLSLDDALPPQ